jgi:hypothetical protein
MLKAAEFIHMSAFPLLCRRLFLCSNIGLEIAESVIEAHTGHFRAILRKRWNSILIFQLHLFRRFR